MKSKLFKRIMSLLLVFIMCGTNVNMVFAEESFEVKENIFEETIITDAEDTNGISMANVADVVTVPARGYADLYPELDSYVGFNKEITINASTEGKSTLLLLYLYDPKGNLKSNDWMMGSNEVVKWSLFLPSSGQWRLRVIASASDTPVRVFARWN